MQPYKQCPQCGQTVALDAPQCPRCGRVYQTTAPGPMQTQIFTAPLQGASPLRFPIGVTAAAMLILAAAWMPWLSVNAPSTFCHPHLSDHSMDTTRPFMLRSLPKRKGCVLGNAAFAIDERGIE